MTKYFFLVGILFVSGSFVFYLFGLMRLIPLIYTIIPMFLSILFVVHRWNNRNRVKRIHAKMLRD